MITILNHVNPKALIPKPENFPQGDPFRQKKRLASLGKQGVQIWSLARPNSRILNNKRPTC